MPDVRDRTLMPGKYPEDTRGEHGDNRNPWSTLKDLADNEPAYTVDANGDYHYKQSDAMNSFSSLVREARKDGDNEKADYYQEFMRLILKKDPIDITEEDFNRLSNSGKLNFFRLSRKQAKLNGDTGALQKYKQKYDELVQKVNSDADSGERQEQDNKPLSQRIHFGLSDAKARSLLVSAMEITSHTGHLPDKSSIYYTFSHKLPDGMERKEPTGYNEFGLDFFKKQVPNFNGSASSLRELFSSDEYKAMASPCIHPQSEGGDITLEEAMVFIHCKNSNKRGKFGGQGKIDCRFYLCPKPDNLVPIMNSFVQKSDEADFPYYFKFSTSPNRNDKLVIYSSDEMAEKHLATLEKIQDEHPEWFEGSGKNPLWGAIKGVKGIYYGAEPQATGKESYGSRRAKIFANALSTWRQEFGVTVGASNYEELIKSENISDKQVKRFKKLFAEECRKEGISPKNFASAR